MRGVQRLCRKYGTLLIADEVASGVGRSGKIFACEVFDLRPGVMCGGLLLLNEAGSTLLLLPALNMDRTVAQNGLHILGSCA